MNLLFRQSVERGSRNAVFEPSGIGVHSSAHVRNGGAESGLIALRRSARALGLAFRGPTSGASGGNETSNALRVAGRAMYCEMLAFGHGLKIVDVVIQCVLIFVVDALAFRKRPVLRLPNHDGAQFPDVRFRNFDPRPFDASAFVACANRNRSDGRKAWRIHLRILQ
jgi:hypothetical protein